MRLSILNIKFHDFEEIKTQNGVVLAKCSCCLPARFAVFVANNGHKNFYYHGYDEAYAQRLFSSLSSVRGEKE